MEGKGMLIYRFKVTSEEYEEFSRDICIFPGQKFIDFYQCILESAELIPAEQASFFLTDKRYKKDREISLHPAKKQVKRYDPEMDEMVHIMIIPKLMKDSKLKDYIEDPHQRMIFEYHGKEYFTFLIELLKILKSDEEGLYPKCVKWVGELPKKPIPVVIEEKKEKPVPTDLLKRIIPDPVEISKLENLVENEAELADIEENLGEILFSEVEAEAEAEAEPTPVRPTLRKKNTNILEEADPIFGEEIEEDEDDKEDFSDGMDHLEDYENIENIELKYSKFSDDGDDD